MPFGFISRVCARLEVHRPSLGETLMDITGTIKNASFFNDLSIEPFRAPCIKGNVEGDTKGRFYDGEHITTSKIEQMYALPDGAVLVKTRFSAYRVEFNPWKD